MTNRPLSARLLTRFHGARLRTQLLLAVNLSMAIVLAGFVTIDYRDAVASRMREKAVALSEEARTIGAAVEALESLGPAAVQGHIDTVCRAMNASESPGHTIEVVLGSTTLKSDPSTHGHDHGSPWSELVSGSSDSGDVQVRVGERRGPVVAEARQAELRRIGAIGVAALIGAVVLNLLLIRLVTLPLERTARTIRAIGSGRLGESIEVTANLELSDLADEVSNMSRELARRDRDRRAQLDRARRLQSHLIPAPSGDHGLSIATEYHPAEEIAGDFVDVIACPNGDTLLCVADVVGHGIHAAMGSAVLKALLLATVLEEPSPAKMLQTINRRYCHTSLPEDFASMVLVRVCPASGHAVYASAGHEIGYVRHATGECGEIGSTGMVLGVDEEATCQDVEIRLEPGTLLALLSDGVSEAMSREGRLLGRPILAALVRDAGQSSALHLAKTIVETANRHRGGAPSLDDITVLAVEFLGAPAGATTDAQARLDSTLDAPLGEERHGPQHDRRTASNTAKEIR